MTISQEQFDDLLSRTALAALFYYAEIAFDDDGPNLQNDIAYCLEPVAGIADEDAGTVHIESAGRRRLRGFGAAQIIVTMLLTNFNIRKIAAFMSDRIKEDDKRDALGEPAVAIIRRRDREWRNPYTDTYPPGVERPDKGKRGALTDETGGPPLRT